MGGSQGWKNRRRQLCLQSLQPPMLWLSCHSDTSWLRRKPQARSRIHPHTDPLPSPWLDTVSKTNPHFRNFRDLTPPSACCAKKRSAQSRGEVVALFPILEEDFRLLPHPRGSSGQATQWGWDCTGPWLGASSSRNLNSCEQENTEIKPTQK